MQSERVREMRGALSTNPDVRLKRCREGWLMYNVHDLYVGRSLDNYGEFSQGEADLFREIIKEGDIVLDVGANIGAHTVSFSSLVGEMGHVIAFEPQRYLYQMMCGNLAINSCRNVYPILGAAGKENAYVDVPLPDYKKAGNFGCITVNGPETELMECVPIFKIDDLPIPQLDLIKIDVEGMELDVLKGADKTLAKHRPVIYAENDREGKTADINRWLLERDYRLFWHMPPLYNRQNYYGNKNDLFPDIVSMNILCIPEENKRFELQKFEEITEATAHVNPLK